MRTLDQEFGWLRVRSGAPSVGATDAVSPWTTPILAVLLAATLYAVVKVYEKPAESR